ncbi:MAG TPA: hypothetical protein VMW80_01055 [Candidatus Dormibacteraeota bacterium]|nr:hypothetical protein [Candidatus Dormibacteraeota bacterium]
MGVGVAIATRIEPWVSLESESVRELAEAVSGAAVELNKELLEPSAEWITRTGAASRTTTAKTAIGMPARRRTRGSEGAGWGVSGSGIQLGPSSRLLDRFQGVCSPKVLASLPTARINDEGTTRSSTTDLPPPPDLRPSPARTTTQQAASPLLPTPS